MRIGSDMWRLWSFQNDKKKNIGGRLMKKLPTRLKARYICHSLLPVTPNQISENKERKTKIREAARKEDDEEIRQVDLPPLFLPHPSQDPRCTCRGGATSETETTGSELQTERDSCDQCCGLRLLPRYNSLP
jgi:hypothetical protein